MKLIRTLDRRHVVVEMTLGDTMNLSVVCNAYDRYSNRGPTLEECIGLSLTLAEMQKAMVSFPDGDSNGQPKVPVDG